MALLSTDNIVAADSAFAVTVHAFTDFCTWGLTVQTNCIDRRCHLFHSLYRSIDVRNNFIISRYHDDTVRSIDQSSYAVGISVHIVKLTIFSDSISTEQISICKKCLAQNILGFLWGKSRLCAIQKIITTAAQQIHDAALCQCNRTAACNNLTGRDQTFHNFQRIFFCLCIKRLHVVFFQICHCFGNSFFNNKAFVLIHFLIPHFLLFDCFFYCQRWTLFQRKLFLLTNGNISLFAEGQKQYNHTCQNRQNRTGN